MLGRQAAEYAGSNPLLLLSLGLLSAVERLRALLESQCAAAAALGEAARGQPDVVEPDAGETQRRSDVPPAATFRDRRGVDDAMLFVLGLLSVCETLEQAANSATESAGARAAERAPEPVKPGSQRWLR